MYITTTLPIPTFGMGTEFHPPEFKLTPCMNGMHIQGHTRWAIVPWNMVIVQGDEKGPIPDWAGPMQESEPKKGGSRGKEDQTKA
jgi:hypothetical protein